MIAASVRIPSSVSDPLSYSYSVKRYSYSKDQTDRARARRVCKVVEQELLDIYDRVSDREARLDVVHDLQPPACDDHSMMNSPDVPDFSNSCDELDRRSPVSRSLIRSTPMSLTERKNTLMSIISCDGLMLAMRAMALLCLCIPGIGELAAEAQDTAKATPEPKTKVPPANAPANTETVKPTAFPLDGGVPVNQWYMNTTDADGAKMSHYIAEYGVESKPGNTIIALHGGWGAEHSYLVPVIKPLADQYRFVLYDQRGSLRSPATPPAKITYDALVEDLDQLRQRLGLEKVTLMAHSMGNMLAYGYLRAHPDRVAGLILVGPVVPGHDVGTEEDPRMVPLCVNDVWPEFTEADAKLLAANQENWRRDYNDRWARIAVAEGLIPVDWAAQNAADPDPDLNALYVKTDQQATMSWRIMFTVVNTFSGRNWRETLGGQVFYNPDVAESIFEDADYLSKVDANWPALKSFQGPVRVIIGTHDYVDLGPTFWPRMVAAMPNARLDTIQNAGHSIWMDEPEAFTRSLRSALEATINPIPK